MDTNFYCALPASIMGETWIMKMFGSLRALSIMVASPGATRSASWVERSCSLFVCVGLDSTVVVAPTVRLPIPLGLATHRRRGGFRSRRSAPVWIWLMSLLGEQSPKGLGRSLC